MNIDEYSGRQVLLKFKNKRAISGLLQGDRDTGFTLKLGVTQIPIDPEDLLRVTLN